MSLVTGWKLLTGCRDQNGSETSRFPHVPHNVLTDGGDITDMLQPLFTVRIIIYDYLYRTMGSGVNGRDHLYRTTSSGVKGRDHLYRTMSSGVKGRDHLYRIISLGVSGGSLIQNDQFRSQWEGSFVQNDKFRSQ
jgi:hypothetical protein